MVGNFAHQIHDLHVENISTIHSQCAAPKSVHKTHVSSIACGFKPFSSFLTSSFSSHITDSFLLKGHSFRLFCSSTATPCAVLAAGGGCQKILPVIIKNLAALEDLL